MDIFYTPATKALKLFREKKLSPVELIKAIIKRAEEINQKTNAFNFTFFEKAIDDAKKSEKKYPKVILGSETAPVYARLREKKI